MVRVFFRGASLERRGEFHSFVSGNFLVGEDSWREVEERVFSWGTSLQGRGEFHSLAPGCFLGEERCGWVEG